MNTSPPLERPLDDHTYDGITEYDNPTPGWLHAIFLASILFSVFYVITYEFGDALPTIHQICQDEENAVNTRLFGDLGDLKPDEPTIARLMGEPKWMAMGASIYRANCGSCHGPEAQGNDVGPNMTDSFYKNVKTLADFPIVIRGGANNLAMPAWKGRLSENQIILMSSYMAALRGQNKPGRAPENVEIPA
mgnify:FL=1